MCVNLTNDIKCTAHELNATTALKKAATASPSEKDSWDHLYADIKFFDNVTGKTLCHAMAVEARKLELKKLWRMILYVKILRNGAYANGCVVIIMK